MYFSLTCYDFDRVKPFDQNLLKIFARRKILKKQNIEVVGLIIDKSGKSEDLIQFVKDRPGHDKRYAMDISKIKRDLGGTPSIASKKV